MPGTNRPSVLDRLIDDHYESAPSGQDWGVGVEQLTRSVVRDLNDLVNTARPDESALPEQYPELRTSLLCYGVTLPGLLGKSAEERKRVQKELELAIRRFEPRLRRVRIEEVVRPGEPSHDASLLPYAFQIRAELRVDPLPQSVLLDATLTSYPQTIRIAKGQAEPDLSPPTEADHAL
jgi:type VI secretion system protein ImpF